MESVFTYVNDIDILGQTEEDLLQADFICREFEALSGVLINRNRKLAILGLRTWAGRQDWPLQWLASPTTLCVFRVDFAASVKDTTAASWQAATIRFQAAIAPWQQCQVPSLQPAEIFLYSVLKIILLGPGSSIASCGGQGRHSLCLGLPLGRGQVWYRTGGWPGRRYTIPSHQAAWP